METALSQQKLKPIKHAAMLGHPDFVFTREKVAVFCDSHFWHGYNWKEKKKEIHRNRSFWLQKISGNILRDRQVNRRLRHDGWTVLRFWEHQILRFPDRCATCVMEAIERGRNKI